MSEELTTPLDVIRGHMLRLTENEAEVDIVAPMALAGVLELLAGQPCAEEQPDG